MSIQPTGLSKYSAALILRQLEHNAILPYLRIRVSILVISLIVGIKVMALEDDVWIDICPLLQLAEFELDHSYHSNKQLPIDS